MRRLATLLTAAAGALLLAVAADARPAAALEWYTPGYMYQAGGAHPYNNIPQRWRTGGVAVRWTADTANDLDDRSREAFSHLMNMNGGEFSTLTWTEVSPGSHDLAVAWSTAPCGAAGTACEFPTSTFTDTTTLGEYVLTARIEVNSTVSGGYSPNGLRAVMLHEILHAYALYDGYTPGGGAGVNESVMNATVTGFTNAYGAGSTCPGPLSACIQGVYNPFNPNTVITHPTTDDLARLRAFWYGAESGGYSGSPHWNGRYTDWGFQNLGSLQLRVWSYDRAWSENWVVIDLYKETSPGVGTVVERRFVTAATGKHQYYSQAAYFQDFDLSAYGAGNYGVCGLPGYPVVKPSTNGSGAWTCTPGYTLIN